MIENPRSARVRAVAELRRKDARSQTGLFLLEGPQSVREALNFKPELIDELFITDEAAYKHPELVEGATDHGVPWEPVSLPVIEALADTVTPQGVVAVCRQFPVSLKHLFDGGARLIVILEEVRDPGNAGTIVRAADAAGADAVVFAGRSVDPYNPKVVRSTTGSLFHVPLSLGGALRDVVAASRAAGLHVAAADVSGRDITEARVDGSLAQPTAWVFGNEARGLSADALGLVDDVVRVPIYGSAESLNLATAASVCLYESAFAQRS